MTMNLSSLGDLGDLGDLDCSSGVCFDNSALTVSSTPASSSVVNQALSILPVMSPGYNAAATALDSYSLTDDQYATLPSGAPLTTAQIIEYGLGAVAVIFGISMLSGGRRR